MNIPKYIYFYRKDLELKNYAENALKKFHKNIDGAKYKTEGNLKFY